MRRVAVSALSTLLMSGALCSGCLAPRLLARSAPTVDNPQRYAEALLSPINVQYTSEAVNGGRSPLWKLGHISPGALAIVPGKGNSLDYAINANWLAPHTAYSLFIDRGSCSSGQAPGTSSSLHRQLLAFDLGARRSDARGEIIDTGTLAAATVPTEDLAVYVQPNDPNGPPGYCGDVRAAMGVVTLAPLHGGKIGGSAVLWQRPEANPGSDKAPTTVTEIALYVHGFGQQAAHLAALETGGCATVPGRVEYPLNDVVTNAAGAGVSGTIAQTDIELVDMNHRLSPLHIAVYTTALQPAACGTLPHNL